MLTVIFLGIVFLILLTFLILTFVKINELEEAAILPVILFTIALYAVGAHIYHILVVLDGLKLD